MGWKLMNQVVFFAKRYKLGILWLTAGACYLLNCGQKADLNEVWIWYGLACLWIINTGNLKCYNITLII